MTLSSQGSESPEIPGRFNVELSTGNPKLTGCFTPIYSVVVRTVALF
jgi:hypothetical protein